VRRPVKNGEVLIEKVVASGELKNLMLSSGIYKEHAKIDDIVDTGIRNRRFKPYRKV
jgi:hypothetical protein